jgi:plasmid stability protein
MASITIRNLDEDVKRWLRICAARRSRSMKSEVRVILEESAHQQDNFAEALMGAFGELGGVELDLPARTAQARAVTLGFEVTEIPVIDPWNA